MPTSSSVAGETHISINDKTETDAEYMRQLEKNNNKRLSLKRQQQQQHPQPPQTQTQQQQGSNYYYGPALSPPSIPSQAIEEALKPSTAQTIAQRMRDKVQCPLCHSFQHFNRHVLRTHIESHPEMGEMRRFLLKQERDYKALLKRRHDLRQVQLPRLQQDISQLDEQIKRFKESVDTQQTAQRIENEIKSRRQRGLQDYDDDPFQGNSCNFDLLEEEEEEEEEKQ